jgi:hypothetical protein
MGLLLEMMPKEIDPNSSILHAVVSEEKMRLVVPSDKIEHIASVSRWLQRCFDQASKRNEKPKPTAQQIALFERAYHDFMKILSELQNTNDPPPLLTEVGESGGNEWGYWIAPYRFKSPAGRPRFHDWRLISEVLAVYEFIYGRPVSASQVDGPTMRFLEAVFVAYCPKSIPSDKPTALSSPSHEALGKRLSELKDNELSLASKRLRESLRG